MKYPKRAKPFSNAKKVVSTYAFDDGEGRCVIGSPEEEAFQNYVIKINAGEECHDTLQSFFEVLVFLDNLETWFYKSK